MRSSRSHVGIVWKALSTSGTFIFYSLSLFFSIFRELVITPAEFYGGITCMEVLEARSAHSQANMEGFAGEHCRGRITSSLVLG